MSDTARITYDLQPRLCDNARTASGVPGMKKPESPVMGFGDIGGRGPHPGAHLAPTLFPADHWPLPQAHEAAGASKPAEAARVQEKAPEAPRKPATTTGLITLQDFMDEAARLGVASADLNTKFAKYFRDAPNEGMRRMCCNNALRCALKKKAGKE